MLGVACCCGAFVVYRVLFVVVCLFGARCSSLVGVCCLLFVVWCRGLLCCMLCCGFACLFVCWFVCCFVC